MKRRYIFAIISIFILIFALYKLVNIKEHYTTEQTPETISKSKIADETNQNTGNNQFTNINIDFKKHANTDNYIPENIIKLQASDILKIYQTKEYEGYKFIVCLDTKNIFHIAYSQDDIYYSICQIENWATEGEPDVFNNLNSDRDVFSTFQNILGYSGVKIYILVGAAASDIFYITIDSLPHLLLSDSLSGDFTECDIDQNGQIELIASFDNYLYINLSDNIYKAKYEINENIRQIWFDEDTCLFNVIFNDGTKKTYQYDANKNVLTLHE